MTDPVGGIQQLLMYVVQISPILHMIPTLYDSKFVGEKSYVFQQVQNLPFMIYPILQRRKILGKTKQR